MKTLSHEKPGFSRRDFIELASGACAGALTLGMSASPAPAAQGSYRGPFCFFSKPLPEMNWKQLAQSVKRVGFDGLDLTVRAEGHVLPGRAEEDLPRAVAAIRDEGLGVPMITTELVSAKDPAARPILSTAGKLGIPYFKAGYYQYKLRDVRRELAEAGEQFRGLAALAGEYGIQLGYHNHEEYVGAPVWDMASVIGPLDPKWVGFYFDPRHATAEGGVGAWKIATNLVLPRLKMIAVKDFYWKKTTEGWRDMNCPLGQGMVDWKYFFKTVAQAGFQGPISLHIEYEVPGKTRAEHEENILATARHDLEFLKARVREAYGAA